MRLSEQEAITGVGSEAGKIIKRELWRHGQDVSGEGSQMAI